MPMPLGAVALSCWLTAAQTYELPVDLLRAIAHVESSGNPYALNFNSNGTVDLGLMQINSRWIETLKRKGIRAEELLNPCVNIAVGAWILSQEVRRYGYTWEAIGAYQAGPYTDKTHEQKLALYRVYAQKVLVSWGQLAANGAHHADR